MSHRAGGLLLLAASILLGAGCAARVPDIAVVELDAWRHVGDRTPSAGDELSRAEQADLELAWQQVVQGRLGEAELVLARLRSSAPDDPGVLGASGFLSLRAGRLDKADSRFVAALEADPGDGFAALGRVLLVLDAGDPDALFPRLQRLGAVEPGAPLVTERLPTLTLDIAESRLGRARELARSDGSDPGVAEAYAAALEVIPDSADLRLEAAEAAVAAGQIAEAYEWFLAVADSSAASERQRVSARLAAAELLADGRASFGLGNLDRLLDALPDLAELERLALAGRAAALTERLEVARLGERYGSIREAERATREQVAALLAAEVGAPDPSGTPSRPVIAIDIERSWAANLIRTALDARYLTVFPDHTFKPRAFVRRSELADSLIAALRALAPGTLARAQQEAADQTLSDVPSGHQSRDAAAVAVHLGLLRTSEDGAFRPRDFASGAEAVRAVHALRDLLAES